MEYNGQQTPDISVVLQEIVDKHSFGPNSKIGIYITGTGNRVIQAHGSGAAATLNVVYTTAECPEAGTSCDDGDDNTENDVENGECCCKGCPLAETPCSTTGNPNNLDGIHDGYCNCVDRDTTIVDTLYITSEADDVEENGKTGNIASRDNKIQIVRASGKGNQVIGLRFTGLSIPSDADLRGIFLEFVAKNDNNKDGTLTIYAEDINNSPPFGSNKRNVSSREKTATSVTWTSTQLNNWTADGTYRTPNLVPIIQELIQLRIY